LYKSVLASLVFGLSIVALSGYMTHLESAYGWGRLTRMAVHTSAGFVVLSTGLLLYVWRSDIDNRKVLSYWLPVPIAIGSITVTICIWQALQSGHALMASGNDIKIDPSLLLYVTLIIGILFSFALSLTCYFAMASSKRAGEIADVNNYLADEISERRRAEDELIKYRDHLELLVEERTRELSTSQDKLISNERLAVLGRLSSGIAHEIRNPLATIGSSAYFLSKTLKDADEVVLKNIERIESEVRKSTAIIQGLQDLATMQKPKKVRMDIVTIIEECLNNSKIPQDIKIAMDIQKNEFFVDADARQMSIMYNNIFDNAVHAMDNRGNIWIHADRTESNDIEVAIRDSGHGIKAEDLEEVFLPFYGTKTNGLGFGLSICQMIIEKHGGEIKVNSEVGKGTTFVVRYPSN
ncbi:MAG: hypothetical protein H8D23_03160, partial [Candidatus Brocadiales bacterium]|nr:hypothetical protein [Candidatus Brocadiales bacterium]